MLDPVTLVARMLLVVGCSGAALMPSTLGTPESPAAIVPHPNSPIIVATSGPESGVEAVVAERRAIAESDGGGWRDPSLMPPTPARAEIEPTPPPLQFNRAEQIRPSPVWLRIPSRDVDARIVPVGINSEGEMGAPDDYEHVGWYRYGAHPGEVGRSVLAGHYDSKTGAAVFYELGLLQAGDEIQVELAGGEISSFAVREVVEFPVEDAPLMDIFGHVDRPELVLVTCAGEFRGSDDGYTHRTVVYADPVGS